ncbi:ABC transporter ATP-binding protein [Anaerorhabdus furcosa]|uniref:ATP-binding cassette, subfamily B n=1 Tax=Anaerorhabdus furcosa TaxID=118967 RepID=A0A1T4PC23_9FIRM|nr:ABC transporter ATP-binding protein [Anaerorhabdus furcosa]SJZ89062.1 ATP-binding cassette, subfamily B [Anaerorhabdus furcosa]
MKKEKDFINEDIPQNFKKTVFRFFKIILKQKKKLILIILSTILSSLTFAALPLAMGLGIDNLVEAIKTYDPQIGILQTLISALSTPILFMSLTFGSSCLLAYFQQYIVASVGEEITLELRCSVSNKLKKLPLSYFDNHQAGDIMSRVTNDLEKVSSVLQVGLMQLISSAFTILFSMIVMFRLSPQLFILVIVSLAISLFATGYVSVLAQKAYTENMKAMGALTSKVEEVYAGNRIIKTFNIQTKTLEDLEKYNHRQFLAQRKSQFADYTIYPIMRFLGQLGFIASAIAGSLLALNGTLTLGTVQAFLLYINQIAEPVTESSYVITSLQAAIAGAERVFSFLDEKEENLIENNSNVHIQQGHVLFEHVQFGYTKNKILMNDLNLEVKPNEMIAIVGPTGGGKTTLVNLLMRFYELNSGTIFIDGHDISTLPKQAMRRNIGMVLQDSWLFDGTIKENIAYGKQDATMDEIIQVSKDACCDHFIRTLPQGYDTKLSSEAMIISQGQMQLLTIARAMLTNPSILILDEATSSVDTRTEVEIQKAMTRLMKGKTSFVISHRLSTIQNADCILVVRDGDIVERGNHSQLLNLNGFYASLYQSQFEG